MAHFAKLNETNTVTQVVVVNNNDINNLPFPESEPIGQNWLNIFYSETSIWRQTSYNSSFRKNYAGVGYFFDEKRNAFVAPQPFVGWLLNEDTCQWEPPTPYPSDGNVYTWDEETLSWVQVVNV